MSVNKYLNNLQTFFIIFLPLSIIIGNFVANITILGLILASTFDFIKNEKKLHPTLLNFLYFLIILLVINLIFSTDQSLSVRGILGIFKYILLFISLNYLFNKNEKNFKYFIRTLFFLIIFVSIDTLIQFLFGKDLFGHDLQVSHGNRLSGPFGDEYVVGAFLSKILFISLLNFKSTDKKYSKILLYIYLLLVFIVIFLSKERAAFFLTAISIFIFIILFNIKQKLKIIYYSGFLLIILTILLSFNYQAKLKYVLKPAYHLGLNDIPYVKNNLPKNYDELNLNTSILDTRHGAHFLTAIEIIKKNFLFGSGIKTFRVECSKNEYEKIKSKSSEIRCNTHPHQIYLEIFSEVGFFGFLMFIFLLYIYFKNFLKNTDVKEEQKIYMFCAFIVLFFPIQTSGSFFSTFNGFFYWISFSVFSHMFKIKLIK